MPIFLEAARPIFFGFLKYETSSNLETIFSMAFVSGEQSFITIISLIGKDWLVIDKIARSNVFESLKHGIIILMLFLNFFSNKLIENNFHKSPNKSKFIFKVRFYNYK